MLYKYVRHIDGVVTSPLIRTFTWTAGEWMSSSHAGYGIFTFDKPVRWPYHVFVGDFTFFRLATCEAEGCLCVGFDLGVRQWQRVRLTGWYTGNIA